MQKTNILLVIGITSLVMLACGLGGVTQQTIQTQSTVFTATDEPTNGQTKDNLAGVESLTTDTLETENIIKSSPTPTVDPIETNRICLARTWEVKGLSDYVLAAVPPELVQEYNLEYEDTTGGATMVLAPDGSANLNTENLVFNFTASFGIFQVPVTVSIDGSAIGKYDIDPTSIYFYDMDTTRMTASAKALNEALMEPEQIIDSIPFISQPYNTAKYSCEGDTLKLSLTGYPGDIPQLVFQAKK